MQWSPSQAIHSVDQRTFMPFIEPKGSLPFWQQPTTESCPEPMNPVILTLQVLRSISCRVNCDFVRTLDGDA
jgi:hypothetical protein